jgi:uncharacterized RDD family membrane protein YckC
MRQAGAVTNRPPGWYADSSVPGHQRWWDGGTWSHVTRPTPGAAPPATGASPIASAPAPHPSPGSAPAGYAPPIALVPLTPDGVALAGPARRLAARIVDLLLVLAVSLAVGFPYTRQIWDAMGIVFEQARKAAETGAAQPSPFALYSQSGYVSGLAGLAAVQLGVRALYAIPMIALRGATLGKLLTGVRVRAWEREGRPGWKRSALRWLSSDLVGQVPYLGGVYSLVDSLWLLRDPRRQCLHDKLPGTVVVDARAARPT